MKHIVLFSGGAASSLVAKLVLEKENAKDVILLHTPTYSEHPDADRFREQVANYLNHPITEQADGRDIWQLIEDNNCLPSGFIPFCTRILKQEQRQKFIKNLNDDYVLYYGFDVNEYHRAQNVMTWAEVNNEKTAFPLIKTQTTGEEAKKIIQYVWKICLPEPYLYLEHNNCIPCFKGGIGHWQRVWKYYPDKFDKAVFYEKKIGHTVFKDEPLKVKAERWSELQSLDMFESNETIPCMCAF
jgi:3'-phosphoadenosine 5'-phosphosulfate sulfotransferase (PAPS reductase)/FAD synthetase